MKKTHTTKRGEEIPLEDLADSHLLNIIRWIEREAEHGVEVMVGGGGSSAEDMWYDTTTIFGAKAMERFGYASYVAERDRRGLQVPGVTR